MKEGFLLKFSSSVVNSFVKEYRPTPFAIELKEQAEMTSVTPCPWSVFTEARSDLDFIQGVQIFTCSGGTAVQQDQYIALRLL